MAGYTRRYVKLNQYRVSTPQRDFQTAPNLSAGSGPSYNAFRPREGSRFRPSDTFWLGQKSLQLPTSACLNFRTDTNGLVFIDFE